MTKGEAMVVILRIINDYFENCINDSGDREKEIEFVLGAMDIIYEAAGFEKVTDSKGNVYHREAVYVKGEEDD